jgi:hypothetical protein
VTARVRGRVREGRNRSRGAGWSDASRLSGAVAGVRARPKTGPRIAQMRTSTEVVLPDRLMAPRH